MIIKKAISTLFFLVLYLLGLKDEGSGHNVDLVLLQVHVFVRHFDELHEPLSVVDCPNLRTQDLVVIDWYPTGL